MQDTAEEMGADAVVGVRTGISQTTSGGVEIVAYGTVIEFD
jgi:uncharacterized protein YbjQ (UPF0145 family)